MHSHVLTFQQQMHCGPQRAMRMRSSSLSLCTAPQERGCACSADANSSPRRSRERMLSSVLSRTFGSSKVASLWSVCSLSSTTGRCSCTGGPSQLSMGRLTNGTAPTTASKSATMKTKPALQSVVACCTRCLRAWLSIGLFPDGCSKSCLPCSRSWIGARPTSIPSSAWTRSLRTQAMRGSSKPICTRICGTTMGLSTQR
mmetsp:Transcript_79174/g.220107  ORF Transcript_79174/g.220107 Transcript_79174/m.220107 type:complete len:200 (+) Transcript_79174:691-1290(+)